MLKERIGKTNSTQGDRGAVSVEYSVLAALLALTIAGGALLLGQGLDGFFDAVAGYVTTLVP